VTSRKSLTEELIRIGATIEPSILKKYSNVNLHHCYEVIYIVLSFSYKLYNYGA